MVFPYRDPPLFSFPSYPFLPSDGRLFLITPRVMVGSNPPTAPAMEQMGVASVPIWPAAGCSTRHGTGLTARLISSPSPLTSSERRPFIRPRLVCQFHPLQHENLPSIEHTNPPRPSAKLFFNYKTTQPHKHITFTTPTSTHSKTR